MESIFIGHIISDVILAKMNLCYSYSFILEGVTFSYDSNFLEINRDKSYYYFVDFYYLKTIEDYKVIFFFNDCNIVNICNMLDIL